MVKSIDSSKKLVTLDKPLTALSSGCNGMIHKCNKIYINKNRHQYKNSELVHILYTLLLNY